jgi:hypothetical protein
MAEDAIWQLASIGRRARDVAKTPESRDRGPHSVDRTEAYSLVIIWEAAICPRHTKLDQKLLAGSENFAGPVFRSVASRAVHERLRSI